MDFTKHISGLADMANTPNPSDRPLSVQGNRIYGNSAVSGVVHVIRDDSELDKFREGEILVASSIPEDWSHLYCLARAVITGTDDVPAHLADAATAFDFAVTVGVSNVTDALRSWDIVVAHIDGSVQRLTERRAPDSQMRVSVPAAVDARQLADIAASDPSVLIFKPRLPGPVDDGPIDHGPVDDDSNQGDDIPTGYRKVGQ